MNRDSAAQVYLVACDRYVPLAIKEGVQAASEALGISLNGLRDAVLHVDCRWVHPRYAPSAYVHTDLIRGLAGTLPAGTLTIGARSRVRFPTRYSFRQAGYAQVATALNARLTQFDEVATGTVELSQPTTMQPKIELPVPWLQAAFTISIPKLTSSTLVPFAGAMRHFQNLLPAQLQTENHHLLPKKMVDLLSAVSPNLIVVDAIQALHKGGELSGEPVDLGVLIVGTDAIAVDMICAIALGLEPEQVNFIREASARGIGPKNLDAVSVLGDLSLGELQARAQRVKLLDPNPAKYPLPEQIKVVRSAKARNSGVSGDLTDALLMLERAGVSLNGSRETAIIIGAVSEIPRGKSDYATIIFLDDTSRGEYSGYSRVVRLRGRNIPLSQLFHEVPYAMKVTNVRAELSAGFLFDKWKAGLAKTWRRGIA